MQCGKNGKAIWILRTAILSGALLCGAWAPVAPIGEAQVGANLARLRDWDSSWVFVDLFKRARTWIPQVSNNAVPWNTGAVIATDSDGWPLLAPGQAAATILTRGLGEQYPSGAYVCLFSGTGSISFSWDAKVVSQTPGRMQLAVTASDEGILCKIESSDPADPIRDIRVVEAQFEGTYATEPFHPLFLDRMSGMRNLRFMDWQETNGSMQVHWADRATPNYFSQATERGVALEYAAELCNTLQADGWFCVPHLATDAYVASMAELLRDLVDPGLDVWIEHSNEVWNGIFPQAIHATSLGVAQELSEDPYQASLFYHSRRSLEIFEIFESVFGGTDRIVRVLAAQFDNPWTGEQVMNFDDAYSHADVLAVAHYFGRDLGTPQALEETLSSSVEQILDKLSQAVTLGAEDLADNQAQAAVRGLELAAYEAGQHLVGVGDLVDHAGLAELFHSVNRSEGMHEVYTEALELWSAMGGGLWCAYNAIGHYDSHGSWGLLEWQDQPLVDAPKFRAVTEWNAQGSHVIPFGDACGGLQVSWKGEPTPGNPAFTLIAGGALPFAPSVLLIGTSSAIAGPVALPVSLGAMAPGCSLYTSFEYPFATSANAHGTAEIAIGIPPSPLYFGQRFFAQWLSVDPFANALEVTLSKALTLQL